MIEELEKKAKEMQKEILKEIIKIEKVSDERWEENQQLKQQLENEKQLNAEIKKRLVEVEYDCEEFNHEYCDPNCNGKKKKLVDLFELVSNGLNETLLKQKDTEIEQLKQENEQLKQQVNGIIWHDLRTNPKDLPEVDRLVRVRLMSGMEHICETDYYEPSEDEIGYGKLLILFYDLNGEWVDETEIIAWCEISKFEEKE